MESLEVIIKIRRIVRSINLESKRIQKDFGISIPQLLCLEKLKNSDNYQSTHSEIMKFLSLNSSTVSGIINRLESKGFVARVPKKEDKRVSFISLTSKGLKVLEKTPDVMHDKLATYLDSLAEEKLKMINSALEIIIDSMEIDKLEVNGDLTSEESFLENQTGI